MTHQTPSEIGPVIGDAREQRIAHLESQADTPCGGRKAVLTENELLVVAELLDELHGLTNPDGNARDPWGRLARVMAVRIYDRLGI